MKSLVKFKLGSIFALLAFFLVSCGVTPLFYPPVESNWKPSTEEKKLAASLIGDWVQQVQGDFPEKLQIAFADVSEKEPKKSNVILSISHQKMQDDQGVKTYRMLYYTAIPTQVEGTDYLCIMPDVGRALKGTKIHNDFGFMVRPYFYLVKVTLAGETLEASLVKWTESEQVPGKPNEQKTIPASSEIILTDGVMMNKAASTVKLLKEKKYFPDTPQIFRREIKQPVNQ